MSILELAEVKEDDQCQHRVIISKIKCAKFQIFLKLPTWIFYPAKSAPKCHF